jgi:hypothetical protein
VRDIKSIVAKTRRRQQTIDSDTESEGSSDDDSEFSSDSDSESNYRGGRRQTKRRRRGGAPIRYNTDDDRRRLTTRKRREGLEYNREGLGHNRDLGYNRYAREGLGHNRDLGYNRYAREGGKTFYVNVKLELFPGKTVPLKWQAKLACQSQYERVRENYADMMGLQYLPNELYIPSSETYTKPETKQQAPIGAQNSRPYRNARFDRDWA